MSDATSMNETLDTIEDNTEGEVITVGDVMRALEHKGFGALLIAPALITILPTGAIPGVPAICGVFIILISLQMAISRKHPWMPKRLKEFSFSRKKYKRTVEKARPYIKQADRYFYPRLEFVTHDIVQKISAVFCIFLSLAMIGIGFIPFLPALFAIAVLTFGIAFSARDGVMTILGFILSLFACVAAYMLWS